MESRTNADNAKGHANQRIENVGVRVVGEGKLESCGGGGRGRFSNEIDEVVMRMPVRPELLTRVGTAPHSSSVLTCKRVH